MSKALERRVGLPSGATLAAIDDTLASGRVPDDLNTQLVAVGATPIDALIWTPTGLKTFYAGPKYVESKRSFFQAHRLVTASSGAAKGGAIGAAIGSVIFPALGALPGGLLGALIGGVLDWNGATQRGSGTVNVTVDGQRAQHKYYGSFDYERTAAELRAELYTAGILGDRIRTYHPSPEDIPQVTRAQLAEVDRHVAVVKKLAEERRLMADFGGRSKYGKRVLHRVDTITARRLLAAGKPLYLINVTGFQEKAHHHKSVATRNDGDVVRTLEQGYVERTVSYTVRPFELASNQIPDGKGLPLGLIGVDADATTFTDVISVAEMRRHDEESNDPSLNGARIRKSSHWRSSGRAVRSGVG